VSRDARRIERLQSRLERLEQDLGPGDGPPQLFLVVFKSGEAGRQQIKLLDETCKRKGIPRRDPDDERSPHLLPPQLVAGLFLPEPEPPPADDDDDDLPASPAKSRPPPKRTPGCDASTLLSLLHRFPFSTARPMPQP
jgi:hypothetical protein